MRSHSPGSPGGFIAAKYLQLRYSLRWKITLPIALVIAATIICISIFVPNLTAENARRAALNSALQTATQFRILREYYAENVVAKALGDGALSATHDHRGDANAIPLPATLIHDISDLLKNENTTLSLYSPYPFPVRGERVLDEFQSAAWRRLSADPDSPFTRQVNRGGSEILRVAIADTCVNCHNSHPDSPKKDWRLGDMRGILEITTLMDDQLAAGSHLSNILILITAIGGGFIMVIALLLGRWISLPLLSMAQTMSDIAEGRDGVKVSGADRRDEIGATARALEVFRQSVDTTKRNEADLLRLRDTLEQRVVERTIELDNAVHAAQQASRAKPYFLATMSHKLRTPLNAIIGFSDILRDKTTAPATAEKTREYAGDINESGQHLLRLITDILDMSKMEAGKFELREESVDVAEVIDASTVMIREPARTGGLTIEINIDEAIPRLLADRRLMMQILINLLSNAVKFTEPGGRVGIHAWASEKNGFVIQISDTGIGIEPENIATAMAAFGQVDNSLGSKFEGTGLGLPLAKRLVELHGGSFGLESKAGEGTVATMRLPAHRIIR